MVERLRARGWEKRIRTDFYWIMLLMYTIWEFWNLCVYHKNYTQKLDTFTNFINFPSLIFLCLKCVNTPTPRGKCFNTPNLYATPRCMKRSWMSEKLLDITNEAPQTWCTTLMYYIHQSVIRTQTNLCLTMAIV